MRVDRPGPVTDRVTLLGRNESCVYLVDGGSEFVILGGGMTCIVPDIISQIRAAGVDPRKIHRLVIHHAHFDHVGIVPDLKARWPWIRVAASARAKALLSRPSVVEKIASLNAMFLSGDRADDLRAGMAVRAIRVDDTLGDGDIFSCGDLELKALAVPGHSSCSMAVYVPSLHLMSASDAGGIPYGDRVFAAANSNFDAYQASLEKMAAYPARVHLSEHYGALTGRDGEGFMAKSIAEAAQMRELVASAWSRHGNVRKAVEELIDTIQKQASGYFLPREVMSMILAQMVRFFERRDGAGG